MSKKEKETITKGTTPADLPKEYRVVVMHFAKHKSYRVYCKKYGTKKGDEIITLLHDLISSRLQNQEFVFWLDPIPHYLLWKRKDTALSAKNWSYPFPKK